MRKFIHLRGAERRLLIQAVCGVVAARAMLRIFPLKTTRRALERLFPAGSRLPAARCATVQQVAWAVAAAAKRAPCGSTCLAAALAGQALLRRHGYDARLRIGVKWDDKRAFVAHAWLEWEGTVVVGGPAFIVDQYRPMPDVECLIQ